MAADPSKPRCTAHTTARRPCRRWPVKGAEVCATHGGSAPQVKAAAGRRLARAEFEQAYGVRLDTDPVAAVLDQLAWAAGHVAWLRDRVQATEPEALVWGATSEVDRRSGEFPGVDTTKAAKANMWLELYGQERDRLIRMAKVAHDMGIEERRVQLAEKLGELVGTAVQGVLEDLGLTDDQWQRAGVAVPARLREMTLSIGGA